MGESLPKRERKKNGNWEDRENITSDLSRNKDSLVNI